MYGLVNQAFQIYIVSHHGKASWDRIKGVGSEKMKSFIYSDASTDEFTLLLAKDAADVLNQPIDELLEEIGSYTLTFMVKQGQGDILQKVGSTFMEVIQKLDTIYLEVGRKFASPKNASYKPPSFKCIPTGPKSFTLQYTSSTEGLAPLIIGLVKGIGRQFNAVVTMTLEKPRTSSSHTDEFTVKF